MPSQHGKLMNTGYLQCSLFWKWTFHLYFVRACGLWELLALISVVRNRCVKAHWLLSCRGHEKREWAPNILLWVWVNKAKYPWNHLTFIRMFVRTVLHIKMQSYRMHTKSRLFKTRVLRTGDVSFTVRWLKYSSFFIPVEELNSSCLSAFSRKYLINTIL